MMNSKKKIHLEIIRVIALMCIMFNHTGDRGNSVYLYTNGTFTFTVSLMGDILCKIGVPLFLMVSGALLLQKEENLQQIYRKRVPRIIKAIVLFTTIRYFYECYGVKQRTFSVFELIEAIFTGNLFTPYWFLYAYLSILLTLPFIKKMIKALDEKEMKLLILLIFAFNAILPAISAVFDTWFEISFMFGSSYSYFVLGYYLEHLVAANKFTKRNTVIAILLLLSYAVFTYWMIIRDRTTLGILRYEHTSVLAIVIANCVFFAVKAVWGEGGKEDSFWSRCIMTIGSCSFGIYLIEDYLRNSLGFVCDKLAPYISVLPACMVWLAVVMAVGVIIVLFLKKLPVLKEIL